MGRAPGRQATEMGSGGPCVCLSLQTPRRPHSPGVGGPLRRGAVVLCLPLPADPQAISQPRGGLQSHAQGPSFPCPIITTSRRWACHYSHHADEKTEARGGGERLTRVT